MRKFNCKLVLYILLCSLVLIIIINKYKNHTQHTSDIILGSNLVEKKPGMKYILLWTNHENIPFVYIGLGQTGFIGRKCPFTNCIVSESESDLSSVTDFDAVVFAGPELIGSYAVLPKERLPYQKFVFASIESPGNYPLCVHNYNGYFNWTWTYKLDSDLRWGYIAIKDANDKVIGPQKDMHWIDWNDMEPVNATFKKQLKSKYKAVAWFVSNCESRSRREDYVETLKETLKIQYDLSIHVYGDCGQYSCPRDKQDDCNKMLDKDYYFYLSFENAFSEDYVTEKLLYPLQNNVVPIVFGGANYSRFLPERSYLDARQLGVAKLAEAINDLIHDPEAYAEFFRWKKYYSYHKTTSVLETNEYCNMCAALNDEELMETTTIYNKFTDFWEVLSTC